MKEFLRLMGMLCPEKKRSAVSDQPSDLSCFTRSIGKLIPKAQYLIPILSLVFVSCGAALAQEPVVKTAPAAQAESKAIDLSTLGIQIGEKVPDVTINNIHNYKTSTAKLSDFKGKLLILDFWATWCSPCVAMIPKMDSLQKEFGDKVQFLSVTYQKEEEVLPFLENLERRDSRKYGLPIIVGDRLLKEKFPHKYLPHYVWIDGNGVVRATTSFEEVNAVNINALYSGERVKLDNKDDIYIDYDVKQPLLFNGISEDVVSFHFSAFSSYRDGLNSGYYNTEPIAEDISSMIRITARNLTLPRLYQIALGKGKRLGWKHTLLNVKEPEKLIRFDISGNEYIKSLEEGRGFCYEIIVPRVLGSQVYKMMENDLREFFTAYEASIESIPNRSFVLRRLDDADLNPLKSEGGKSLLNVDEVGFELKNYSLNALIVRLNDMHHSSNDTGRANIFFFNETDFKEPVDLTIDVDVMDTDALKAELQKHGLLLEEEIRPIPMLVIRDKE